MDLKWNYGQSVLVLPAAALEANASDAQLRVLLWLASDQTLAQKSSQLARLAACTKGEAEDALAFWREQGILAGEGEVQEKREKSGAKAKPEATRVQASAKPPRADLTPQYTTAELADMMEKQDSLRILIDASGNVLGKVIQKVSDVRILAAFLDYYGYEEEFILLLLKYCKEKKNKTALGWIEKFALGLRDDYGIETVAALEEWIRNDEMVHSLEGKVRRMFGIKERELIGTEKRAMLAWASYGYGEDVIRKAYEITIASIREPSIPYANSILEKWHAEGLKTLADVERRQEETRAERKAKAEAKSAARAATKQELGSSFDIDDFFEAAIQRSFEEVAESTKESDKEKN